MIYHIQDEWREEDSESGIANIHHMPFSGIQDVSKETAVMPDDIVPYIFTRKVSFLDNVAIDNQLV